LLTLAGECPETLFVSDEAYGEYATGSLVASLATCPNLLVMKTLSKIGLAGLRVGFAIGDPALIAELDKARAPYNVSSVNQRAAHWVMSNHRELLREQCAEIVCERLKMDSALREVPGIRVFPSEANLILFRVGEPGAGSGPKLWEELCRRGVLIRTFGSSGPLADCLRVTLGTTAENKRFLQELRASLAA
jgi:histidinol-phosphate aminotransferase